MSFRLPHDLAGRYRLIRPLGEGGFAETFLALDLAGDRQVAIKVLRGELARDRDMAARFAREARATAAVRHPNVVAVFDHGEDNGSLYTVMEFVDGSDLRQEIRARQSLRVGEALRLIDGVLAGLGAIHEAGIIHRDVKPENILLSSDGTPKLSDFGIARTVTSTGLTATGVTLGTASYMAPEQATGEALGPPTDLYAAGVVLFEMLTGQVPFPADNPLQTMFQHVHQSPPRPTALNPEIPPAISAVVLRALAKDPERRFPTATAMRQALAASAQAAAAAAPMETIPPTETIEVRAVRPVNAAPPSPPGPRLSARLRWPLATAAAMLILVATMLVMLGSQGQGTPAEADAAAAAAAIEPLNLPATPAASTVAAAPTPTQTPVPTQTLAPSPTPPVLPTPTIVPATTPVSVPEIEPTTTPVPEPEPQQAVVEQQISAPQPEPQESQETVSAEPTPAPALTPAPEPVIVIVPGSVQQAAPDQQRSPAVPSANGQGQGNPDDHSGKPEKADKPGKGNNTPKPGKGNQGNQGNQGNNGKGKN